MRIKIFIITLCLIMQSGLGFAQKPGNKKSIRFHSINKVGVLAGSSEANLQLQTINGIKSKTWFTGLGVGLDYYYLRSIPVFLDVGKNVFNKSKTPFIYIDGGYNIPWKNDRRINFRWDGVIETEGGFYGELGVGYKIPVLKKMQLLFSAGYSYKHLSQTVNAMHWLSIWPPPPQAYEKHEYSLRRMAIKAGLSF